MAEGIQVVPETGREPVSCHVCSSDSYRLYLEARSYTIVECEGCGFRYVNPQPSLAELETMYAEFDQGDQWRRGEEHFNRGVRRAILRFKRAGTALDVGSGSGNFLRCLREAGFAVYGVEPSASGSEYARAVHQIETYHGGVEDYLASGPQGSFDVVTILNVLEHLKDPRAVLRQLHALLRAGGILVVVVPDARLHSLVGTVRRKLGCTDPFWMDTERHPLVGFDPPHHLSSFEPRTILRLLERCDFRVFYMRHAPVIFNEDRWKNVAKLLVRTFSELLCRASGGKIVFGYSTLVIARKG
jgi:SAM-dependent methyltransferase